MDLGITDRVALVAASSKGLGRAVAEELAAEGAHVVMCARGSDALREAAEAVRGRGTGDVLPMETDLSDAESIRKLTDAALSRFGRVDILVNNAGGPPSGSFEDHAPEA